MLPRIQAMFRKTYGGFMGVIDKAMGSPPWINNNILFSMSSHETKGFTNKCYDMQVLLSQRQLDGWISKNRGPRA
jgi:hypothetical protein